MRQDPWQQFIDHQKARREERLLNEKVDAPTHEPEVAAAKKVFEFNASVAARDAVEAAQQAAFIGPPKPPHVDHRYWKGGAT